MAKGNWIADATQKKGALHRRLGMPLSKKIPAAKLRKAAHAGGVEGKEARLAETLSHLRPGTHYQGPSKGRKR